MESKCDPEETMIVHKFGGTSVGSGELFGRVADIIVEQERRAHRLRDDEAARPAASVVILSAMSGTTDRLIAGARAATEGKDGVYREIKAGLLAKHLEVVDTMLTHSRERLEVGGLIEDRLHDLERLYRSMGVLGELTARGADAVVSFGEQLSMSILAAILRERGARAQAVCATELIVTDDHFGAAAPLIGPTRQQLSQRVKPLLAQGVIPVITGYIAATDKGVTTTLGRGGSDYTAAIVGAGLEADEVWIWSDVDGILTADPNIVPQARTLSELSYSEATELAYFGAEVLHPKTIRPVIEHSIPLRILNTFNPTHPGTLIVETPSPDRELLPAIISTTGLSLIAIGSQEKSWTLEMAARGLQQLSDAGVDVLMFSQSFSEQSLNLVVRERDQAHCLNVLCREFGDGTAHEWSSLPLNGKNSSTGTFRKLGDICSMGTKEKVATVSVVGLPGRDDTGISAQAFAALGKHGARVIAVAQAATEQSISFCIPEDQLERAVRFLHRELGLEGDCA
jgi:aspartokinase/homoserine dehydrogenase 1